MKTGVLKRTASKKIKLNPSVRARGPRARIKKARLARLAFLHKRALVKQSKIRRRKHLMRSLFKFRRLNRTRRRAVARPVRKKKILVTVYRARALGTKLRRVFPRRFHLRRAKLIAITRRRLRNRSRSYRRSFSRTSRGFLARYRRTLKRQRRRNYFMRARGRRRPRPHFRRAVLAVVHSFLKKINHKPRIQLLARQIRYRKNYLYRLYRNAFSKKGIAAPSVLQRRRATRRAQKLATLNRARFHVLFQRYLGTSKHSCSKKRAHKAYLLRNWLLLKKFQHSTGITHLKRGVAPKRVARKKRFVRSRRTRRKLHAFLTAFSHLLPHRRKELKRGKLRRTRSRALQKRQTSKLYRKGARIKFLIRKVRSVRRTKKILRRLRFRRRQMRCHCRRYRRRQSRYRRRQLHWARRTRRRKLRRTRHRYRLTTRERRFARKLQKRKLKLRLKKRQLVLNRLHRPSVLRKRTPLLHIRSLRRFRQRLRRVKRRRGLRWRSPSARLARRLRRVRRRGSWLKQPHLSLKQHWLLQAHPNRYRRKRLRHAKRPGRKKRVLRKKRVRRSKAFRPKKFIAPRRHNATFLGEPARQYRLFRRLRVRRVARVYGWAKSVTLKLRRSSTRAHLRTANYNTQTSHSALSTSNTLPLVLFRSALKTRIRSYRRLRLRRRQRQFLPPTTYRRWGLRRRITRLKRGRRKLCRLLRNFRRSHNWLQRWRKKVRVRILPWKKWARAHRTFKGVRVMLKFLRRQRRFNFGTWRKAGVGQPRYRPSRFKRRRYVKKRKFISRKRRRLAFRRTLRAILQHKRVKPRATRRRFVISFFRRNRKFRRLLRRRVSARRYHVAGQVPVLGSRLRLLRPIIVRLRFRKAHVLRNRRRRMRRLRRRRPRLRRLRLRWLRTTALRAVSVHALRLNMPHSIVGRRALIAAGPTRRMQDNSITPNSFPACGRVSNELRRLLQANHTALYTRRSTSSYPARRTRKRRYFLRKCSARLRRMERTWSKKMRRRVRFVRFVKKFRRRLLKWKKRTHRALRPWKIKYETSLYKEVVPALEILETKRAKFSSKKAKAKKQKAH